MNGHRLPAVLLAALAGCAGFSLLALFGWVLYQRVFQDSLAALLIVGLVFGAGGLYGGWLLSMIVFSALSGGDADEQSAR
ncbi:MAG: hypothetical protein JF888_09180 [Candidatus Dormibacteraeota bacterium]|uniref:Uncharacterized protein n=1 Tax=Candidatus Dormiibacter inghamiae TaxID=3127013 RepID=A0A934KA59_9BACT|nr:hypothetical protein [Candidatus Dormibacteraeota bacterium]MBJ7606544.1 hypothetical protein [Candidatus Dormibacteraeota bacterium]